MTTNVNTFQAALPLTGNRRGVHTTSSTALRAALDSLPDWTNARDQLNAWVDSNAAQLPTVAEHEPAQQLRQLVMDSLAAGDGVPADLAEQAARINAEGQTRILIAKAMHDLPQILSGAMDAALSSGSTSIFRHLHSQLQDLLVEAADVFDALGPVRTPGEAISADVGPAFKAATELAERHADIRAAQAKISREFDGNATGALHIPFGYVAEPEQADAEMLDRELGREVREPNGDKRAARPAAWPDTVPDWKTLDALAWLVDNPAARPWVPTPSEIRDAQLAFNDRLRREQGIAAQQKLGHASKTRRIA